LGVNAASEASEAYGAYRATYAVARKYEGEVLLLHQTISVVRWDPFFACKRVRVSSRNYKRRKLVLRRSQLFSIEAVVS
jgi:hypothetical protein